ncbi:MAG: ribose 5-phosphate isomerase A [Methanobacteriota archaeon]|jgi:ribose 5-phosphate isomerase A|uniref:Ribose-5-phosphate isomerase A n=1 Tax=Halorutilus salinus TaxID=2487751 RepID=A0A9Q4C4I5_9EURY|nr:ribose-5-phosphate isomerase RpiA [Halorutilus salinus]MCX2819318.1 ribose-5-phosphate isomerase RpiA [Halorutilus salinus]
MKNPKDDGGGDRREAMKKRSADSAVALVEDGDVVGLGTGSTAEYAVRALGERVDSGLDVRGIPTSHGSRAVAVEENVPLTSLDVTTPDIVIDGADAFDADLNLVKGGGAAHAREKVVARASDRVVTVVDETKERETLNAPVPLEVLDFAVPVVRERVEELGGRFALRETDAKDGAVVSDNGNVVADAVFDGYDAPALADELDGVTGVVEHGLFVGIADEVHVGRDDGVEVVR